jgi:hypothetical protein
MIELLSKARIVQLDIGLTVLMLTALVMANALMIDSS